MHSWAQIQFQFSFLDVYKAVTKRVEVPSCWTDLLFAGIKPPYKGKCVSLPPLGMKKIRKISDLFNQADQGLLWHLLLFLRFRNKATNDTKIHTFPGELQTSQCFNVTWSVIQVGETSMEMAFIILNVISCSFLHMKCSIQVIYFMFPNFFFFFKYTISTSLFAWVVFWGQGCGGGVLEALYSAI